MIRLAVTGGIACGKSVAAAFLAAAGLPVCDADDLAHAAMATGAPAYRDIVDAFGTAILKADGSIDRRALGQVVFGDAERLATLNRIVHPCVLAAWQAWLPRLPAGTRVAVAVIPLLYECGLAADGWQAVVCVSASRATQVRRIMERGFTERDAQRRIDAQLPLRHKELRADYVVVNEGPLVWLQRQMEVVLCRSMEKFVW